MSAAEFAAVVEPGREIVGPEAPTLVPLGECGPAGSWWSGRSVAIVGTEADLPVVRTLVRGGHVIGAIAWCGYLANREDLLRELPGPAADDACLAGQAWLRWGPSFAAHLEGGYAAAIWSTQDQVLTLARDHLGVRPLHYLVLADKVVVATRRSLILDRPDVRPVVDVTGLAEILTMAGTPGQDVYAGMAQVPAGCTVRIHGRNASVHRYWSLRRQPHEDDPATTTEYVRHLLQRAVRGHLDGAPAPVAATLSGGIDSSTVTALAAASGASGLRTFTVGFGPPGGSPFRADDVWSTPDEPHARVVADHLGLDLTRVTVDGDRQDTTQDTTAATRATIRSRDVPSPLGHMNAAMTALYRRLGTVAPTALHGDPADALFGGYDWLAHPAVRRAGTLPWIARTRLGGGRAGFGADLLHPDLLLKLDLDAYARQRHGEAVSEIGPLLHTSSPDDGELQTLSYLQLTRWPDTLIGQSEALARQCGVQVRYPFLSPDLVTYAFSVPWFWHQRDERGKSVLRDAVQHLLPTQIVDRRKSPFPITQQDAFVRALSDRLDTVLHDHNSPAHSLIDHTRARSLLADPTSMLAGPTAWVLRASVELVLQLDSWLTDYAVDLHI